MIPTALLFGLLVGRRWAILLAAFAWPILVFSSTGNELSLSLAFGAAIAGAANTGVGVLVHTAVRSLVRSIRATRA
jgi:hypothetical protein